MYTNKNLVIFSSDLAHFLTLENYNLIENERKDVPRLRMISKQTVLVNGELLVSFKLSVISVMSIKAYSQKEIFSFNDYITFTTGSVEPTSGFGSVDIMCV